MYRKLKDSSQTQVRSVLDSFHLRPRRNVKYSCRNLRDSRRKELQTLPRADLGTRGHSLLRRTVQGRTVLTGRVPDGAAEGALQDQDFPPEYRQIRYGRDFIV